MMATKEQKRAEYLRNREKYIARATKWAANNPEKRKEISRRDNVKRSDSKIAWNQVKRYGHVIELDECARCGAPNEMNGRYLLVHHVDGNNGKMGKPLNNDLDNLIVLCKRCHPRVHYRGQIRERVVV